MRTARTSGCWGAGHRGPTQASRASRGPGWHRVRPPVGLTCGPVPALTLALRRLRLIAVKLPAHFALLQHATDAQPAGLETDDCPLVCHSHGRAPDAHKALGLWQHEFLRGLSETLRCLPGAPHRSRRVPALRTHAGQRAGPTLFLRSSSKAFLVRGGRHVAADTFLTHSGVREAVPAGHAPGATRSPRRIEFSQLPLPPGLSPLPLPSLPPALPVCRCCPHTPGLSAPLTPAPSSARPPVFLVLVWTSSCHCSHHALVSGSPRPQSTGPGPWLLGHRSGGHQPDLPLLP